MRKAARTAALPLILILGSVVPARAGHVYGRLAEGQAPASGIALVVACGGNAYQGTTDQDGSYRLFVRERGKCSFTAQYKGQSPSAVIYSYDDPVGYNFEIQNDNGVYRLVRR